MVPIGAVLGVLSSFFFFFLFWSMEHAEDDLHTLYPYRPIYKHANHVNEEVVTVVFSASRDPKNNYSLRQTVSLTI